MTVILLLLVSIIVMLCICLFIVILSQSVFYILCSCVLLCRLLVVVALYIFRPPGTTVPDGLMFYRRCIFFFVSPLVLQAPSTDRPETLPHGQNLAEFYNPTPKIRGALPPKKGGPKTCKISVNFGPLQPLIANISGTAEDIRNRPTLQTMAIPPAFKEKSPVNFGPLTAWNYM